MGRLRPMRSARALGGAALLALTLNGCDMAPAYRPAQLVYPPDWEGQGVSGYGHPDEIASRPDWWTAFGDPELNRLEQQALAANPEPQAMAESFTQARDVAAQGASDPYPQVEGMAGGECYKSSH